MQNNFYQDVIVQHPFYHIKIRVAILDLLEPVTRLAAVKLLQQASDLGVTLRIIETYRSKERQEMLYEQKATQLRQVGVHHYGLAFDVAVIRNGVADWKAENYAFLKPLAMRNNLVWGGNWQFKDLGHFQRVSVKDQPKLFAETWYPDDKYTPEVADE